MSVPAAVLPAWVPRLVVLDVDGTLLDHNGRLPDHRAAPLRAISQVLPTMFATGKTWPSIEWLARDLQLQGPHLTCNGAAAVQLDGRVEVLDSLPRDVADDVVAELVARDIATSIYLDDGTSVTPQDTDRFATQFDRIAQVAEAPPTQGIVPDDAAVLKVLAIVTADDEGDLRSLHADTCRIQRTGTPFLEWNAPTATKGHGLELFADRHEIDLAHVVTCGDSENDVSMFGVTGLGVAVSSASPEAVAGAHVQLDVDIADWFAAVVDLVERDAA